MPGDELRGLDSRLLERERERERERGGREKQKKKRMNQRVLNKINCRARLDRMRTDTTSRIENADFGSCLKP